MTDDVGSSDDDGSPVHASLTSLVDASTHDGPIWSQTSDDLNVNLVVLREGHTIGRHVNSEVDVLLVGIAGSGIVTIDDQPITLAEGELIIVPKESSRSIVPIGSRFAYLTCHKRRSGLWPARRR